MILEKNNIHMNRVRSRANIQFTLDEDINVPDNKSDIGKTVCNKSDVVIDTVNFNDKKVNVSGKCNFAVLYTTDAEKSLVEMISGEIPFNEILNVDEAQPQDMVKCQAYIEDFTVRVINSRKISIKAVVNVVVTAESIFDEEIAKGTEEKSVKCKMDTMSYACIAVNGNDIFRVKEEYELPKNKPDVNRILWKDVSLRSRQVRLLEDGFSVKGELCVFILYDTYEEGMIEWEETVVPFAGKVDYPGIHEEMVSDIAITIQASSVDIKSNADGEDRQICLEVVMNLDIRVYEEKNMNYLADIYSLEENVMPVKKNAEYEQILIKNSAKCRAADKIKMKSPDSRMLQICRVKGDVHMDDIVVENDGMLVEGAVIVDVMYIAADDRGPVATIKSAVPFSQKIEVAGVSDEMVYTIRPNVEQLTATVLGNDEIEVRAFINLDALIFKKIQADFITDVSVDNSDLSWVTDFPGIIGYIAKNEESIWDIAKKYRTTVENIKTVNNLSGESIHKGDKILITR